MQLQLLPPPVSLDLAYVSFKMATIYENVIVSNLEENGLKESNSEKTCRIEMSRQGDSVVLCVYEGLISRCYRIMMHLIKIQ